MEELTEVLDESAEALDEDQRELVDEICQDLTDNMGRIRQHGNRADSIVHDMLMMGRGSGERHPTEINSLLDEHASLAYHSARATDPDFNLAIEKDLTQMWGKLRSFRRTWGASSSTWSAMHATLLTRSGVLSNQMMV